MNLAHIIIKPVVTEKTLEATRDNRYTFLVAVGATKDQIKKAIKTAFGVDVVAVRTTIKKGLERRTGRRRLPTEASDVKKAVVEVAKGQSIKVFETKGQ